MKNYEEAESCLRRAVKLHKKLDWAHCNLGLTLQEKKDYNGALEQFQQAITLNWDYGLAHICLADLFHEFLNQPNKAIAEYEIGIQLEKRPFRLSEPMWGFARALEAAGRSAEARQRYQEYLDRFPWGEHAQEAQEALERLGEK
jgi:TolA-binding protein